MKELPSEFVASDLGEGHVLWMGYLPTELRLSSVAFEALWQMHPHEFHEIEMYGRSVKTPRWQQAFGRDYRYTGRVNKALTIPVELQPFLMWVQKTIHPALNGLLLNWYDAGLGHYIGRHRDSIKNLIPETPIVTISLGQERIFRLRRWRCRSPEAPTDFRAGDGAVFVMPWKTNLAFTHEIPRTKQSGRRISITARAFA